jgi:hypothetical protein
MGTGAKHMTQHKFPDPQPINWDALEVGDTVWIKGKVGTRTTNLHGQRKELVFGYGPWFDELTNFEFLGHVIKAPRPIAVGDTVRVVGPMQGHWVVLALDDDVAWLRHTQKPTWINNTSVRLANLVRVEP